MHRYARPYRNCIKSGCAYRRRRRTPHGGWLWLLFAVFVFVLICIMPLWLTCSLLGLAAGFLVCLLLFGR